MNVQERVLEERIDPYLSDRALTELARRADEAATGIGATAAGRGGPPSGSSPSSVRGYHILTGGCWNRVIGIRAHGRDLVCKISPHPNDEKIVREFDVLSSFARETDLQVPEPLYLDAEGEILPGTTLVMTRIPGAVMHECFGLLNFGQRRRITDQIAEDLAHLHKIRSTGFGGVELDEGERSERWSDFWLPRFDRVIDQAAASGSVPAPLIEGAREIRPHLRTLLDVGSRSTMTHYDIWSGNVMIDLDADPPRVSGYIDIPGFYADYARELSFAMLFGIAGRRFFETYLKHHELDDGFELRANVYNVKMNIRHVQMYPAQTVYQQGAAENLEFVRRTL